MLNRQHYEDFFKPFLSENDFINLQTYIKNLAQIQYWDQIEDKERGQINSSMLKKQNQALKPKLTELLSQQKVLENGFQIKGNIFHQLVFVKGSAQTTPPGSVATQKEKNPYSIEDYKEIIKILLTLDIDPNTKDSIFKQGPLSAAIGFNNLAFASALLSFHNKINLDDISDEKWSASTPLLLAIQRDHSSIALELIKLGASVNQTDKYGLSPLHWTMIMANSDIMKELFNNKSLKNSKAFNGKYAIDYLNIKPEELDMPLRASILYPNETNAPELRPIIAHFWNDRAAFFKLRENRKSSIDTCAHLLRSIEPVVEKKTSQPKQSPIRFQWADKNTLIYKDSEGVVHKLENKENIRSGFIINLLDVLDSVESNTDVVIAIGSGDKGTDSWQQNIKIDENKKRLIINLDPYFAHSDEYKDTKEKRYFGLSFNSLLLEMMEPLLKNIINDKNNNLIICDFRDPGFHSDCSDFLNKYISHYRDPDSSEGNLLFLQGYFFDMPVFWPKQTTISTENEAKNVGRSTSGEYSKIISFMHNSPERRATPTQHYDFFFKKNAILDHEKKGYCFMYPMFGSLIAVQKEIQQIYHTENRSLAEKKLLR